MRKVGICFSPENRDRAISYSILKNLKLSDFQNANARFGICGIENLKRMWHSASSSFFYGKRDPGQSLTLCKIEFTSESRTVARPLEEYACTSQRAQALPYCCIFAT